MFHLNLNQQNRQILHIDADAFFASVEQILDLRLRGKPVLVGGPSDTSGIVSAASYEARAFGVKSGMAMYLAKKKCPGGIVVHGNFDAYRTFSRRMYGVFSGYTPDIEMASIDEAYLDITGCGDQFGMSPEVLARKILMDVYAKLGLSVSGGMASSKTVAKVASSMNKPHKLTIVPYGKERGFLAGLELRAMPGIGPKTCAVLERMGLRRLGDLAEIGMNEVVKKFGMTAIGLWKRAQGFDNTPVISTCPLPKSISKEHTFYEKVLSEKVLVAKLRELGSVVFEKLRRHRMKAGTIFVKIRYWRKDYEQKGDVGGKMHFVEAGAQRHLDVPSCCDNKLFAEGKKLFLGNLDREEPVRKVGIGVSGLKAVYNLSLFERDEAQDGLFYAIDALRQSHGEDALKYGAE